MNLKKDLPIHKSTHEFKKAFINKKNHALIH